MDEIINVLNRASDFISHAKDEIIVAMRNRKVCAPSVSLQDISATLDNAMDSLSDLIQDLEEEI